MPEEIWERKFQIQDGERSKGVEKSSGMSPVFFSKGKKLYTWTMVIIYRIVEKLSITGIEKLLKHESWGGG